MRLVARLVAVATLVVAGGLALPGGAAQASACSNSTGVTVVVDYGSTSSTVCAGDRSSAGAVLESVLPVTFVPMYGKGVVCKINGIPSNQTCQRMPPASAYWAFFHASRGGSWSYSSSGVADYDPAPGSVIGFAFGSGGAPTSAPPAAVAPKPSTRPSASSSSSKPPAPTPKPASTTPATPSSSRTSAGPTLAPGTSRSGSSVTKASPKPGTTTGSTTTTTTSGTTTPAADATSAGAAPTAAGAASTDSGSPTTLLAGLGLVGLVGAGAAYLAVRRRSTG